MGIIKQTVVLLIGNFVRKYESVSYSFSCTSVLKELLPIFISFDPLNIIFLVFTLVIITTMLFWLLDMVQDIGWLKILGEDTLVKMVSSKSKVELDFVDLAGN